jgi:hypothetical protein
MAIAQGDKRVPVFEFDPYQGQQMLQDALGEKEFGGASLAEPSGASLAEPSFIEAVDGFSHFVPPGGGGMSPSRRKLN